MDNTTFYCEIMHSLSNLHSMSSQEKQEIRSYRYTTINSIDVPAYFTFNVFHDLILISSHLNISSPFPYQTIFLGLDCYKNLHCILHREKVDSSQTCTSQMNELGLISTFFLNPRSSAPRIWVIVLTCCVSVSGCQLNSRCLDTDSQKLPSLINSDAMRAAAASPDSRHNKTNGHSKIDFLSLKTETDPFSREIK